MKRLIVAASLIATLFVSGCNDAYSAAKCMDSVRKEFPNSDVCAIPDTSFKFIVKTENGDVWYAECLYGFSESISAKTMLIRSLEKMDVRTNQWSQAVDIKLEK